MNNATENRCHAQDVAAYLDGELSGAALINFEEHLQSCGECDAELRAQRQLLCTLEVAFNNSRSFELPVDFTRVVTKRAESDLSGMRKKPERRRALKLCAILTLISFALMGAATRTIVFEPVRMFFRATSSVVELSGRAAYESFQSATVVIRVFSRAVFFSQNGVASSFFLVLIGLFSFLLFLIARYHRAQIVE